MEIVRIALIGIGSMGKKYAMMIDGKHVFCDKPSGISLLQCRQMNHAAQVSGKKFAIMFHQRLYEKHRRIKEILDSGRLGNIRRVLLENSRYFRTSCYHSSAA